MHYEQRLEKISIDFAHRWDKLLANKELNLTTTDTYTVLTESVLERLYGAPWRRYHTFVHLSRMFEEFEKIRHKLKHPACVEFAICTHESIYVPGAKNNEAKSARLARAWLRTMYASPQAVRQVGRLITFATKHPKSPKARLTSDEKYMSDLDLYGLSLSYDAVLGQSRDVRREFSDFSDQEFRKGHGNFLANMLARRIYLTNDYSKYEIIARENIQSVLKNMDQVVIARPNDKRL